jgi:hypothetical protein
MLWVIDFDKLIWASEKSGAEKVALALFEKPYISVGIPTRFLSSLLFLFSS